MCSTFTKLAIILFALISFNINLSGQTVTDYDGNVYNTVTIGSQIWLKENLKSLRYCDGSEIPGVAAYNNLDSLADIYGRLYTWDAAMNGSMDPGTQGVCPCEWHLPTSAEWAELENYLGGSSVAGGKMKDTTAGFWLSPNTGATNSSGFTGLPAGEYDANQGIFQLLYKYAVFWTSTSVSSVKATERYLAYNNTTSTSFDWYKTLKYSIRCVKDNATDVNETEDKTPPDKFILLQNYPNPFNPSTIVQYSISQRSKILLKVFDTLGNEVATLVNEEKPAGTYEVEFNPASGEWYQASGIYFCRLQTTSGIKNLKIVYLK